MAFNFNDHKRKLELDGWKFSNKKSGKSTKWIARKKSFLSTNNKIFTIFEEEPCDKDLKRFVDDVKKFENKNQMDEAILIAPSCDRFALSKFIEKTGLLTKGRLKEIISFRSSEAKNQIQVPKDIRKQILEEEMKKPSNIKQTVKIGDDYKVFKKICNIAKNFEIGPQERKNEKLLEILFKGFLKGALKKEIIDYQANSGVGRYDIFIPNRKIGIELKVLKRTSDLTNLEGQIRKYLKDLEYLCVVIVNLKSYDKSQLKETVDYIKTLGRYVEVIVR